MKFPKTLLALGIAALATTAQAGTAFVGPNGGALAPVTQTGTAANPYLLGTLDSNWTALFVTIAGAGSFTEYANFTVPTNTAWTNAAAATYALTFSPGNGQPPITIGSLSNFSVDVVDSGSSVLATLNAGNSYSVSLPTPAAGAYQLKLSGLAVGAGGQYSVGLQALPVPEPETYVLLLAGLFAGAFMLKRKRG